MQFLIKIDYWNNFFLKYLLINIGDEVFKGVYVGSNFQNDKD